MFHWPVRVYYEDTDSGGVVYYANYLKFMERARSEWLRSLGFEQDVLNAQYGIIFAVRSVTVEYLRPARFNDLLSIGVQLGDRRAAELRFKQSVRRTAADGADDLLCTGEIRLACLDSRGFRPRRIPEFLMTEIERES
ncbi:MAG: tol-pal system-associated acyl-CoA thioesterase [Gammaproteobacteria bacterium]|jgi:acyl-CoA thioester hydrolase|nr:tol-pal system-associated acyl-CoA thioesterase [Gammaproteobacteria bacterium]